MANRKEKLSAEEMAERYARHKSKTPKDLNTAGVKDDIVEKPKKEKIMKTPEETKEVKAPQEALNTESPAGLDESTANIFGEEVKQRAYSHGPVTQSGKTQAVQTEQSVPEPKDFELPPVLDDHSFEGTPPADPTGKIKQPTKIGTAPSAKPRDIPPVPNTHFRNEALDEMPNIEKDKSAEAMADTLINLYVIANNQGKKIVQFDEEKATLKAIEGKFDFGVLDMDIQKCLMVLSAQYMTFSIL